MTWPDHLIVAPILVPLAASAMMLFFDERRHTFKLVLGMATMLVLLAVSALLLQQAFSAGSGGKSPALSYAIGDWPAPFGIVLVLDRLSAVMLMLSSILGLTSLLYASARWDRAGPRFHGLLLLQLVGLNGAFLTGDLFNLFVFFEVLLAASYGLLLHGSGPARVKAGLHYVSINVAASLLFLIGASLIYGSAGTLNMADLAMRIPDLRGSDLPLFQSGMGILGIAFLIKAGMWPLSFWLVPTYSASAPPVAALFTILSKVGVYAILRVYLLLFASGGGAVANFGDEWLLFGGMATVAFGTIGILAGRTLSRVAGFSLLVSSGTLLAMIGAAQGEVLGAAIYYLVSSTLAVSAFYLLIELVERRGVGPFTGAVTEPVFEDEYTGILEEADEEETGLVIPATIAILGIGFIFCALLLAGFPPLSGFIAKFALIDGLIGLQEDTSTATWWLIALIIISGLATLVATTRAGIDLIWTPSDRPQPVLRLPEAAAVGILLTLCLFLMIMAGPVMRFMDDTGSALQDRGGYITAVLGQAADVPEADAR